MENHNESVVATVVAFVLAVNESRPASGKEFNSPKEALDSRGRGWFFVKLRLPNGEFDYEPGLHLDCRAGYELYARFCTQCGKKTWVRKAASKRDRVLCLDCSERAIAENSDPTDYGFDWSEHEEKCDGCSFCNRGGFANDDED